MISIGRLFILLLLAISPIISLYSENIRGRATATLQVDGPAVEFKPEELIIIRYLDEIPAFQEGIEIQVEIPSSLRKFRNSFALMIYRNVSPDQDENRNEYNATRIHMELIPSREKTFVRIPFSEIHKITGDALTSVLPIPIDVEQFPLLVTVLPIMKGIPDAAFSEELIVRAIPIWKEEGSLTVNITSLSGNPEETIEVTVDETAIELNKTVILPSGIHKVRAASTHAPAIEQSITLEPGEEITLNLTFDYKPPELTIHIPQSAIVRLDDKLIESNDSVIVIEADPGEHSISYILGEMEVSRSFSVQPGSKINIKLFADVEITERSDSGGGEYGKDYR